MTLLNRFAFTFEDVIALWCQRFGIPATVEQMRGLAALIEGAQSPTGLHAVTCLWYHHNFHTHLEGPSLRFVLHAFDSEAAEWPR